MKNKFKMNKSEKSWVLYDVANSAYVLMATALIPIYYNVVAASANLSQTQTVAIFSTMLSVAALVVALLNPVLGAIADNKGMRKKMFAIFMLIGAFSCFIFGLSTTIWYVAAMLVLGKIGLNGSLVFNDAMLVDVTKHERMDKVSSNGYAWGYVGSCIPFIVALGVYILSTTKIGGAYLLPFGEMTSIYIGMIITGIWWIVMSLPLLKTYKQIHGIEPTKHQIRDSFKRLGETIKNIKEFKVPFMFAVAFFFFINGVSTIIGMSVTYATQVLGANAIDSIKLVLALLMTQFVAWPSAIVMGNLSNKVSPKTLILISIGGYFAVSIYGIFLNSVAQFFIMAFFVGLFQGGIQALSRSYFAKLIPKHKSNEFFGFFDICGKGAAILGPAVMALGTIIFQTPRAGVGVLVIFFLIGGGILLKIPKNVADLPNNEYLKLKENEIGTEEIEETVA